MSMKIDRIQDDKILWSKMYENKNTDQYQVLEGEVNYAVIYKYSLYFQSNLFSSLDWVRHGSDVVFKHLHGEQRE